MSVAVEQAHLEDPRRVEPPDPQHRAGGRGCCAGRHQADELGVGDLGATGVRFAFDAQHDLVQRRGLPVLDVHAHLRHPRPWEVETERSYAGEPAAALTHDRRDRTGDVGSRADEVDVERDQRRADADQHAAGACIETRGAGVGDELGCVDPALQRVRAAATEEGGAAATGKGAVMEDGQAERSCDRLGNRARARLRAFEVDGGERHDRDDVRGADARVCALVLPKVDSFLRDTYAGEQGLAELRLVSDEREDAPVVVLVGVEIENARVRGEGVRERVDPLAVASFREVRHGFERPHARTLGTLKAYYDARAPEYDHWYLGLGGFGKLDRENWHDDVRELERAVAALPPARTLDVACGTGFLTRHLRGDVTGLDQSERMLGIARESAPHAGFVRGDALELPFEDGAFERVFTGHFYGHLEEDDLPRFLAEARRVAKELVVADTARRPDREPVQWEARLLSDGTRWDVFKRYFEPQQLVDELGGGVVLVANRWFVLVRA